jgi:hypothetical protein
MPEPPRPFEVFQHFKGSRYLVTGLSKHSETLEMLVTYQKLGDPEAESWTRPLSMWYDKVASEERNYCGPRFTRIFGPPPSPS